MPPAAFQRKKHPPRHVHHARDPGAEDAQPEDPAREEDRLAAVPREELLAPGERLLDAADVREAHDDAGARRSGRSRSRCCRR